MLPSYLTGKTIAVWDIEADLIPSTQVFCISVVIVKDGVIIEPAKLYTQYWVPYSDGSLLQAFSRINQCDYNAGHNIIGYDVPTITRILGIYIKSEYLDTLIISKIIFSKDDLYGMDPQLGIDKDLYGAYSLKAFGQRMGDFKIDFHDFSGLTEEMGVYCNQDTTLTAKLLIFLMGKPNFPIKEVIDIEHKAAIIIAEQADNGFYIDITRTRSLNTKLLQEKLELYSALADIFQPKLLPDGPVKTYKKPMSSKQFLPNPDYTKVW